MTQSISSPTVTIDLSDYPEESFVTDTGSEFTYNISSSLTGSIDTISPTYTIDSSAQSSLVFDNITIVPTLWKEALPDVDTVNAMCNEYPALAKAYENFKTVYKLVEQDYKGKKEDEDL